METTQAVISDIQETENPTNSALPGTAPLAGSTALTTADLDTGTTPAPPPNGVIPKAPEPTAGHTGNSTATKFAGHELWSDRIKWVAPLSVLLLLLVVVLAHWKLGAKTASAVLTVSFITGAAVGIERAIEGFWNFLGSKVGTYWPMTSIAKEVDELENELADAMAPFHSELHTTLGQAQNITQQGPAFLAKAAQDMQNMKRRFDDIRAHAPSNQRMQLLAASASQSVNFLVTKYEEHLPGLRANVALADTAIGGMQDFLATFKDNPGRRLLSLYLGMLLGLVMAGLFGLDVFAAVDGVGFVPVASPTWASLSLGLRVAVTGLLIGLGSNPTHEVIQALQEYKKGRKGENSSKPKLPSDRLAKPATS